MSGPARVAAPSVPRVALQIDRADLDDFQRAARTLLAHPLVTERWPEPGALVLVRRWETALGNELNRVLGYRLDVSRTCARLYRRSADLSVHRGPRLSGRKALGRWACSLLCLTLAAIESLGEQTTLSDLADEILRLRSGDEELPVDLTQYDQRRALVDAVGWLEERGVLTLRDGGVDRWLSEADDGDALYDLDRDTASRLLVASPSVLRDVRSAADFLIDTYPRTPEGEQVRLRQRLARRLVEDPVVLYETLPPDELAHVRQRRGRIVDSVERLTGALVETRAEGMSLIDPALVPLSAEAFPARGSVAHAALLWGSALVTAVSDFGPDPSPSPAAPGPLVPPPPTLASAPGGAPLGRAAGSPIPSAPPAGRVVAAARADAAWAGVVEGYRSRFSADYRADPAKLRADALELLVRFGLLERSNGGALVVHAAMARYRPAVRLAESSQLSLLGTEGPG